MGAIRVVVLTAFAGACSFTFLLLACALPQYSVWWPMFMLLFYVLTPLPIFVAKAYSDNKSVRDVCAFFTTILIFSAYALPILLARAPPLNATIKWGACGLTITANTFMFATIFWLLYVTMKNDSF